MKSFGKRYVTKNSRTAVISPNLKYLPVIIKRIVIGAVLIGLFGFSVNLLVKSIVSKLTAVKKSIPVKWAIKLPNLSLFSEDKYLIEGATNYIVSSSGKVNPAGISKNDKYIVRLIGVEVNEQREEYLKALKQALNIDKKYLTDVSDVNMANLKNIIMVTTDGATISFGDSITNEKMENYRIAAFKLKELGKGFNAMNLTYQDMAIIK
ncbi:MAG: hypothetical protein WCJ94_02200 [bacterium]